MESSLNQLEGIFNYRFAPLTVAQMIVTLRHGNQFAYLGIVVRWNCLSWGTARCQIGVGPESSPKIGQIVTLSNHNESMMVKSVSADGQTVELMTLTGIPAVLREVPVTDLFLVAQCNGAARAQHRSRRACRERGFPRCGKHSRWSSCD